MSAVYFNTQAELHDWLAQNHAEAKEILIGFYKTSSSKKGITYAQALDEALCFGWIDGIRKGVDEERYTIRWTPRKAKSIWSSVNLKRVPELIEMGKMQPSGLKAYEGRDQKLQEQYSYEMEDRGLEAEHEKQLKANSAAWAFFQASAPSYQKAARHWVNSAKQETTRLKRLNELIEHSANGQKVPPLRPWGK